MQIENEEGNKISSQEKAIQSLLDFLNAYQNRGRLRSYQKGLYLGHDWLLKDPVLRKDLPLSGSCYHRPKSFSYRFGSGPEIVWLHTAPISHGYGIFAYQNDAASIFYCDATTYPESFFRDRVKSVSDLEEMETFGTHAMVYGHINFAHEGWNELSALIEENEAAGDKVDLLCISRSLLDPGLLNEGKRNYKRIRENQLRPSKAIHVDCALFSVGSELLSRAAQKAVIEFCRSAFPLPAKFGSERFRVWVSLRQLHRRAINEIEVLSKMILILARAAEKLDIVLDGYSVAADISELNDEERAEQWRYRDEVSTSARTLLASLPPDVRSRTFDFTQSGILESISVAGSCSFYVCHHGTQQHKIGWFYSLPGIVHANKSVTRTDPAGWVQRQAELSVAPSYAPEDCIEDVIDPENDRNDQPYFHSYVILEAGFLSFAENKIIEAYESWACAGVVD